MPGQFRDEEQRRDVHRRLMAGGEGVPAQDAIGLGGASSDDALVRQFLALQRANDPSSVVREQEGIIDAVRRIAELLRRMDPGSVVRAGESDR